MVMLVLWSVHRAGMQPVWCCACMCVYMLQSCIVWGTPGPGQARPGQAQARPGQARVGSSLVTFSSASSFLSKFCSFLWFLKLKSAIEGYRKQVILAQLRCNAGSLVHTEGLLLRFWGILQKIWTSNFAHAWLFPLEINGNFRACAKINVQIFCKIPQNCSTVCQSWRLSEVSCVSGLAIMAWLWCCQTCSHCEALLQCTVAGAQVRLSEVSCVDGLAFDWCNSASLVDAGLIDVILGAHWGDYLRVGFGVLAGQTLFCSLQKAQLPCLVPSLPACLERWGRSSGQPLWAFV